MKKNRIVTISREFGSGGRTIGRKLAEELGVPCYDSELIGEIARESGFAEAYVRRAEESSPSGWAGALFSTNRAFGPTNEDYLWEVQRRVILELAEKGPCVIVGRCADYILRDEPNVLKVFVHAPLDQRIRRAREEYGAAEDNLESYVIRQDKARAAYHNYFAAGRWGQSREYDLCVNSRIGIDASVQVIQAAAEAIMEA